MPANPKIIEQMRERQKRVFRIAMDPQRYGLTLKMIETDSGIDYDSLRNYAAGKTTMPATAVDLLIDVLPDELLSLLLSNGRRIVRLPDNIDLDEVAAWSEHFSARKLAAHRKDSECEEQIGPGEEEELKGIIVAFPARVA